VLTVPVFWLKEIDSSHVPQHKLSEFGTKLWETLQNQTTLYILIFVVATHSLSNFGLTTVVYLQYYVIELTNFEAGIDTITSYLALIIAIWLFQKLLINRNWRITQYASTVFVALLQLIWIAPYYNTGGTQNAWFTIFVDLDSVSFNNITHNGNDNRINIIENSTIEELNNFFYKKKVLNYLLNENISIYHKLEKIEEINDKYYICKISNGGLFKDFN
jgi:hypothetical protein